MSTLFMMCYTLLGMTDKQRESVLRYWIALATAGALNKFYLSKMSQDDKNKLIVKDVERRNGKGMAKTVKKMFKDDKRGGADGTIRQ